MPQITNGKAVVTTGEVLVVAEDATVDWSTVSTDDGFVVPWSTNGIDYKGGVLYQIAATESPATSPSGFWELRLSAPFAKPSGTVFYAIVQDFWPTTGAPKVNAGDVDTRMLLNLAIGILDTFIGSGAVTGSGSAVIPHSKTISGGDVGAETIAMTFDTPLDDLPAALGMPVIIKSSPSQDNVFVLSIDSVTEEGYNVNLSAPAIAGQKITNWHQPAAA